MVKYKYENKGGNKMAMTKELKKNKLLWTLIIMLGVTAIIVYSVLYNEGIILTKTDSKEIINKLRDVQEKGGQLELTQKDVDEITNLYFGKPKIKGDITLQDVNVELLQQELLIKLPISYKKLSLLFSSRGKLKVSNGEVSYAAEDFKLGKLRLSKKLVISRIGKLSNENFYVKDNLIIIKPSLFPFKINSLEIVDSKILVTAEKLDIKMLFKDINKKNVEEIDKELATVGEKIDSAAVLMNKEEKEKIKEIQGTIEKVKGKPITEKKKAIVQVINKLDQAIDKISDSDKKEKLEKIKIEVEKTQKAAEEKEKKSQEQEATKRLALRKVHSELSSAYSQLETSKEQQVISMMLSTVSKMMANTSYDSASDQAYVKDIYGGLDSSSKERVKGAIFSNVGGDSIGELRQAFGM